MIRIIISLILILIIVNCYKKGRFLSSTTLYCGCYFLIFIFYPICNTEEIYKNSDIIDLYALAGIIAFVIGSSLIKDKSNIPIKYDEIRIIDFSRAKKAFIIIALFSSFIFVKQVGLGRVTLVLAGELSGKQLQLGEEIGMTTYGYFIDIWIALIMAMVFTARDRKEKMISFLALCLYVVFNLLFGFTRIFTISILAMVVFHKARYLSLKKQFIFSSVGVFALMMFLVTMNFIRCFGIGQEISFEKIFDIGYIFESSDFGASYVWFDRLLNIDPPYIRLDTYLKPILYLFIPRSIWPNKPEQVSMQVLKILDPGLAATGYSTAGYTVLGEGYAMIGYVGIVVFPLIWGMVCKYLDTCYYRRKNSGYNCCIQDLYYYIFAIFVIISGQRGDWNQYLIIVFWFYMLPIRLLSKKKKC